MKHRRATQQGRLSTIDVWLCMSCGHAFPFDNREISLVGTTNRHVNCHGRVAQNISRGHLKHIGDMAMQAAEALCGARFQRHLPPPTALTASIGERTKPVVLSLVTPTPERNRLTSTPECKSCGEPLTDGACQYNTPHWPHETT
jgi:hypothetical protein